MNNSEWVDIKILADALGFKTETLRRGCASEKYVCRFKKSGKYKNYEIAISSLPSAYLKKYNNFINKQNNCLQLNSEVYDNAQEWQRKQADKYLQLITLTDGMSYNKTVEFLKSWNSAHPDKKVCYTSLYYAKQKYEESGVAGLLSQKGQGYKKQSIIPEDYYEYYKSLYLREGAPSAFFCWQATLGYAKDKDNIDILKFPSYKTFERLLKSRIPEQAIYMARFGNAAWNKKYASYIPRDYSNLRAGSCWVSDHAQIDVAVSFNGSVCFPWVTVFRDVKTSKWLGWFLHAEAPNSDHIFQAFYYGVQHFGLPDDIYLDNGKDYRCKDFAGGRTSSIKVEHNSMKEK